MGLPKLNSANYELSLPSTGATITYRPFLVKEQKALMIAQESEDEKVIESTFAQIINDCVADKVDPYKMPMFDIEYIFLQIRAKSVGEVSKLKVLCPDDKKTYANVEVDLTEVEVQVDDSHNNKIELSDEMGVIMKYPSIDSFSTAGIADITADNMIDVVATCIAQIYDKKGEEVFEAKDSTKQELIDFVEQLNSKQFKDLQKFFDTMPKLKHTVTVKNPKTKKESKITLTGLNDFFA